MTSQAVLDTIERQRWLRRVDDRLGRAVDGLFAAAGRARRPLRNFLHGRWLGHPPHPALTDVPIGASTVALVFDVLTMGKGRQVLVPGADAAIEVGLAGAAGAAVAGLTDWNATGGAPRRVGLVHGLLNTAESPTPPQPWTATHSPASTFAWSASAGNAVM